MKGIITAIIVFAGTAFISGCSIGIAIIAALNNEESQSLELKVETNPSNAEVYLDGEKLGAAPITVKIVGLDTKHKIETTKNGYRPEIATVFISSGHAGGQEYLVKTEPDGTYSEVKENVLNLVLEKEHHP